MPHITTNYNYMTLKMLREIRDNQYRSRGVQREYYPHLIEEAIQSKRSKLADQFMRGWEVEESQQFEERGDDLRGFLSVLNRQGTKFLASETLKLIARDLGPHVADYK